MDNITYNLVNDTVPASSWIFEEWFWFYRDKNSSIWFPAMTQNLYMHGKEKSKIDSEYRFLLFYIQKSQGDLLYHTCTLNHLKANFLKYYLFSANIFVHRLGTLRYWHWVYSHLPRFDLYISILNTSLVSILNFSDIMYILL